MIPWETLARARTPGGAEELTLCRRGELYVIRIDGRDLMTSRVHGSEEVMARIGCAGLDRAPAPRVLVGGLGLGYTLRAALDRVAAGGTVVVAELVPEVVQWNREVLGHLAGFPLDDPRTEVAVGDVAEVMRQAKPFDAILLDVDNGPRSLVRPENGQLYSSRGIAEGIAALRPGGVLVIWSASPDELFVHRMQRDGYDVAVRVVGDRGGKTGAHHSLFVVRRAASRPPRGKRAPQQA